MRTLPRTLAQSRRSLPVGRGVAPKEDAISVVVLRARLPRASAGPAAVPRRRLEAPPGVPPVDAAALAGGRLVPGPVRSRGENAGLLLLPPPRSPTRRALEAVGARDAAERVGLDPAPAQPGAAAGMGRERRTPEAVPGSGVECRRGELVQGARPGLRDDGGGAVRAGGGPEAAGGGDVRATRARGRDAVGKPLPSRDGHHGGERHAAEPVPEADTAHDRPRRGRVGSRHVVRRADRGPAGGQGRPVPEPPRCPAGPGGVHRPPRFCRDPVERGRGGRRRGCRH
mmetsp:Transcript_160/g.368  ORF Transcript_160/g.368 Transcript_160/m.368 type:complete len:284 (+) Transcript_160:297-1148(+)